MLNYQRVLSGCKLTKSWSVFEGLPGLVNIQKAIEAMAIA